MVKKCRRLEDILVSGCGYTCGHGGWSQFGSWSQCSEGCSGERTRVRSCNGAQCVGSAIDAEACTDITCPGKEYNNSNITLI